MCNNNSYIDPVKVNTETTPIIRTDDPVCNDGNSKNKVEWWWLLVALGIGWLLHLIFNKLKENKL